MSSTGLVTKFHWQEGQSHNQYYLVKNKIFDVHIAYF